MSNLDEIFEKKLNQLGIKKQVEASLVVEEAQKRIEEIFGEKAKGNLKAISYRGGILKIAAKTSSWAAECQSSPLDIPGVDRVVFTNNINDDLL